MAAERRRDADLRRRLRNRRRGVRGVARVREAHSVSGASFSAIGAFRRATLAFFDLETNEYEEIPVDEQVEVLSLSGNLGLHEGEPKVHAHVVVGLRDGSTRGGHLLEATVRPTLEVVVTETPGYLRRVLDEVTGLPLIDLGGAREADNSPA